MIFWTVVGTWTGTLIYDRTQTKKTKQKWCTLVSHIARESLPTNQLPRRMTIYLAAPPSDSLSTTREHFVDYVKPVLVAAAMDWDVVEGRREGDIRAALADRIRRQRHVDGEPVEIPFEETPTSVLDPLRARIGVEQWPGENGDIIVGRNTWKEYVRGLHEGWLGPMDAPPPPPPAPPAESPTVLDTDAASPPPTKVAEIPAEATTPSDSTPSTTAEEAKTSDDPPKEEEPTEPEKPLVPPPYNMPDSYASSHLPPSIPSRFAASTAIHFPHILGFFNTPIRMWRFLNRRSLADDIGRQTAAAVLASHRHYHTTSTGSEASNTLSWEQQDVLVQEEQEWHKSVKEPKEYAPERIWLDDVVIDARIGERMRRFELQAVDEERARAIGRGQAGIPGRTGDAEEKE